MLTILTCCIVIINRSIIMVNYFCAWWKYSKQRKINGAMWEKRNVFFPPKNVNQPLFSLLATSLKEKGSCSQCLLILPIYRTYCLPYYLLECFFPRAFFFQPAGLKQLIYTAITRHPMPDEYPKTCRWKIVPYNQSKFSQTLFQSYSIHFYTHTCFLFLYTVEWNTSCNNFPPFGNFWWVEAKSNCPSHVSICQLWYVYWV